MKFFAWIVSIMCLVLTFACLYMSEQTGSLVILGAAAIWLVLSLIPSLLLWSLDHEIQSSSRCVGRPD